jgi:hypothetical protein
MGFNSEDWKEELGLIILYRMLECGDRIPVNTDGTDYSFVETMLQELFNKDLICVSNDNLFWEPTQKGVELRNKMVGIFDQLRQFEIFAHVSLDMELDEDISDDGISVSDHLYNPLFPLFSGENACEELNTQDLRLTMIDFLHTNMKDEPEFKGESKFNKRRLVFFQMLADGGFDGSDVWFNLRLGTEFQAIDSIVATAYPWTALADTKEESDALMRSIYTAGRLEERKRDGYECNKCGIPLAVFELNEKETGRVLTKCPNPECNEPFIPPEPEGELFECPNCNSEVSLDDSRCLNCGAIMDLSMPSGSVDTEDIIERETVYESYDYTPYGWYDPYDPFYDVAAFSLLCVALW